MSSNICIGCKYFNTCGNIERIEPCNGRKEDTNFALQATCIKWDYGEYDEIILPTEVDLPNEIISGEGLSYDNISNYLSDLTGFCCKSYTLEKDED